jgi:beta-phosphoglucomutase
MNHIKAVLFDYDGVLADTMEDMHTAWSYAINVYTKIKLARDFFFLLEGKPSKQMAEDLMNKYKIDKRWIEEVIREKEEYYFKNNNFKINEKIIEIVNLLKKKGILIGVVSGAPRSRIIKMTPSWIIDKCDVIVTSDDVSKGKPDPQPYLRAVEKLGIKKHEVIVIENAPLGIESAIKAGLFCIAIESTLHRRYLKNAHKTLKDFDEMLVYFRSKF